MSLLGKYKFISFLKVYSLVYVKDMYVCCTRPNVDYIQVNAHTLCM